MQFKTNLLLMKICKLLSKNSMFTDDSFIEVVTIFSSCVDIYDLFTVILLYVCMYAFIYYFVYRLYSRYPEGCNCNLYSYYWGA